MQITRNSLETTPGPSEDHCHGAASNRFMTHIAMQEGDEQGSPVTWGEHVSDEEYGAAPSIDR